MISPVTLVALDREKLRERRGGDGTLVLGFSSMPRKGRGPDCAGFPLWSGTADVLGPSRLVTGWGALFLLSLSLSLLLSLCPPPSPRLLIVREFDQILDYSLLVVRYTWYSEFASWSLQIDWLVVKAYQSTLILSRRNQNFLNFIKISYIQYRNICPSILVDSFFKLYSRIRSLK